MSRHRGVGFDVLYAIAPRGASCTATRCCNTARPKYSCGARPSHSVIHSSGASPKTPSADVSARNSASSSSWARATSSGARSIDRGLLALEEGHVSVKLALVVPDRVHRGVKSFAPLARIDLL